MACDNAREVAVRADERKQMVAAYDAAVKQTFSWCGPFGHPGVGDFFDRRDRFIRAALAEAADGGGDL